MTVGRPAMPDLWGPAAGMGALVIHVFWIQQRWYPRSVRPLRAADHLRLACRCLLASLAAMALLVLALWAYERSHFPGFVREALLGSAFYAFGSLWLRFGVTFPSGLWKWLWEAPPEPVYSRTSARGTGTTMPSLAQMALPAATAIVGLKLALVACGGRLPRPALLTALLGAQAVHWAGRRLWWRERNSLEALLGRGHCDAHRRALRDTGSQVEASEFRRWIARSAALGLVSWSLGVTFCYRFAGELGAAIADPSKLHPSPALLAHAAATLLALSGLYGLGAALDRRVSIRLASPIRVEALWVALLGLDWLAGSLQPVLRGVVAAALAGPDVRPPDVRTARRLYRQLTARALDIRRDLVVAVLDHATRSRDGLAMAGARRLAELHGRQPQAASVRDHARHYLSVMGRRLPGSPSTNGAAGR